MKTYCLTLDLKDNPALIDEYKRYHRPEHVWPEVIASIKANGILSEEIYLFGNRLMMILRTEDHFSFEAKAEQEKGDAKMQAWEELMWKYQQTVPGARPGEKWVLMEKIFEA